MGIITLKEYAERLGVNPVVARNKAIRGGFVSAYKFGRDWVIDEDEPYKDGRIKSGRYLNSSGITGKNISYETKQMILAQKESEQEDSH